MNKFKRLTQFIRQPSTLRGIVGVAAVAGYSIQPQHIEAVIVAAGLALSLIEALRDESKQQACKEADSKKE